MAHKKSGGKSNNGRDSAGRRLGLKKFGSEVVKPGAIILRQRGTKFHPGRNAILGRDHTIHSVVLGRVEYYKNKSANRNYVKVIAFKMD